MCQGHFIHGYDHSFLGKRRFAGRFSSAVRGMKSGAPSKTPLTRTFAAVLWSGRCWFQYKGRFGKSQPLRKFCTAIRKRVPFGQLSPGGPKPESKGEFIRNVDFSRGFFPENQTGKWKLTCFPHFPPSFPQTVCPLSHRARGKCPACEAEVKTPFIP